MNTHVQRAIVDHAHSAPHEEVCGFIYQATDGVHALPCANVAPDARHECFEIDPADYVRAQRLGRVVGLYHGGMTHGNPGFSEEDLEVARELALPSHVYCGPRDSWAVYVPPTYHVNPVALSWCWGLWDCYETVRLHYRQQRGVFMTDYARDESFERAAEPIITRHVADEGFVEVSRDDIQRDDVLLFRTPGAAYPQHLAVVIGPNQMVHHPRGQLSRIDVIDGAWLRRLVSVFRYAGKEAA